MAAEMRSVIATKYTDPSGYQIANMPRPTVTADTDVVIKVHAASINPIDVKKVSGFLKMAVKEEFPYKIGYDAAGVVTDVGSAVRSLKVGDEVYTRLPENGRGSWSEYAKCAEYYVSLKPKNLDFGEAASIPLAALTAYQALDRYEGGLQGKTVFIPAGLSGTGAYAIQLAKNVFGAAKVITTVSTLKVPKIAEHLGQGTVDQVIDYTKETLSAAIPRGSVDFMFDTTNQGMECLSLMRPKTGLIISVSSSPSGATLQNAGVIEDKQLPTFVRVFLDALDAAHRLRAWRWGVSYAFIFLQGSAEGLDTLRGYVEDGRLRPLVGSRVNMMDIDQVREAAWSSYRAKGLTGKIVLEIEQTA